VASPSEKEFQLVFKLLIDFCLYEDQLFCETGFEYQALLRSQEILDQFDAYQSPEKILKLFTKSREATTTRTLAAN
jgi:hypothetical protein